MNARFLGGVAISLALLCSAVPSASSGASRALPSEGLLVFSCDCTDGGETPLFTVAPDGSDLDIVPGSEASSAPRWSPNGRTIAYQRDLEARQGIWVSRGDGSGARRLTRPGLGAKDSSSAWSPRGDRLAFVRSQPGARALLTIDAAGRRSRVLLSGPETFTDPDWSPDGSRIAGSRSEKKKDRLWVVDADGSGLRPLGPRNLVGAQPRWSPEGARVAFVDIDASAVRVLRLRSGRARTVFDPEEVTYDVEYNGWGLAWSPDGRWLAVLRTAAVECVDDPTTPWCEQAQIWIVSAIDDRQTLIYTGPVTSWGYGLDWRWRT